jgi:hypothetical protein
LVSTTGKTLRLGDDANNRQYRSILSFQTSEIPDYATITSIKLNIKTRSIIGDAGNPLNIFKGFMVDIKSGLFGSTPLQAADFQRAADETLGPINITGTAKYGYSIVLTPLKDSINKFATNGGLTQIRLRFRLDDNNDQIANQILFYSGNAATHANRPGLLITYTVP